MKKYFLFLFLLLVNSVVCQQFAHELDSYQKYQEYKGKPLSDKFSNIESVKVIYDLNDQKMYYFNSLLVKLHIDFVTNYLGYEKGLDVFNHENYSALTTNRDFLLGNLNHIKGTDKWIFELAASDHMPIALLEHFYYLITKSTFIGTNLKFYVNNREKLDWYLQKLFTIPCITSNYIFDELQYQEVVTGDAVGYLKKYSLADLTTKKPNQNEIIIVDGTPETLPNVRAIIVTELQTPLSHLIILGKNRKIPIMAFTKATTNAMITNLINKKIELTVATDTFFVKESLKKITIKTIKNKKKLAANYAVTTLVDLSKINKNGVNYIGAKAQNLSYLIAATKTLDFKTPENAYAIPFYFYANHIKSKKIQPLITALLNNKSKDSTQWINNQLKKIRTAIKEEKIDSNLINQLNKKLANQTEFKNFRFRSSTNAEDIEGFNGAGLYESRTGIVNDSIKTFEKAIKTVWASVFNESSYWEREYFGIDQSSIAMGVLVHRAFPDELANGVIITKNIFRDHFTGITINVQIGENSVVKPSKGEVCEQFTVYDFNLFDLQSKNVDVDYVSHSNLNNNEPILTTLEINKLYKICKKLEAKMYGYWKKVRFYPIDLEFKLVGANREIYIKQVRPYSD